MDDKTTPNAATPPMQPTEPTPAPPLDLATPLPKPESPTPLAETPPTLKPETPSLSPIEHDTTQPTSTQTTQPLDAISKPTTSEAVNESSEHSAGELPPTPSTIPSMPATSSIPPMPSMESNATTPMVDSTAPNPVPAPIAPLTPTNSATPTVAIDTPPIPLSNQSNSLEATATLEPVAQSTTDAPPPKKSKALVFVVIFLALVALTLGGLVVWGAMQPKTSSIEESMTPPVVSENEEVGEITEEEVIVEQPDPTADWKTYTDEKSDLSGSYPNDYSATGVIANSLNEWSAGKGVVITNANDPSNPQILIEAVWDGYGPFFPTGELTLEIVDNKFIPKITSRVSDSEYQEMIANGYVEDGNALYQSSIVDYQGIPIWVRISHSDKGNAALDDELLKILSTFKFNSTASSTTPGAALQGSCTQDGETYADGDEVPAPDSCNSCSCDNGQIACTAMACEE